ERAGPADDSALAAGLVRAAAGAAAAGRGVARARRAGAPAQAPAARAVRRRDAAGRHRPRPDQPAAHPPGRRAHRQPRRRPRRHAPRATDLKGPLMPAKVYINGKIYDKADAKISVYDHGLLYGDGVFEGIRVYSGKVFRLRAHVERLFESARAIKLEIPLT